MKSTTRLDSLPTLDDFPDYVIEREKLRRIISEFEQAESTLASVDKSLTNMRRARANYADESARARIEGKQEPIKIVLQADRDKLDLEVQVLRSAVMQQSERTLVLRDRYANEIFERAKQQHLQLMNNILAATVALSEALDAENDFIGQLRHIGVNCSSLPRCWKVFNAIGSRRQWVSGVNEVGRLISAYLGREWSHSQVQR